MKVIIHSSVSLDGSLLGFEIDIASHYKIESSYKADIHPIGTRINMRLKKSRAMGNGELWLVFGILCA